MRLSTRATAMTASDLVGQSAASIARNAFGRLGIFGTPVRDLTEARRWITIGASTHEIFTFLSDPVHLSWTMDAVGVPAGPGVPTENGQQTTDGMLTTLVAAKEDRRLEWSLRGAGRRGSGWIELREAPRGLGSEVTGCLRFEHVEGPSALTFTRSAGVLLTRMLHRTKAYVEGGKAPSLAHNPAHRRARDRPDEKGSETAWG